MFHNNATRYHNLDDGSLNYLISVRRGGVGDREGAPLPVCECCDGTLLSRSVLTPVELFPSTSLPAVESTMLKKEVVSPLAIEEVAVESSTVSAACDDAIHPHSSVPPPRCKYLKMG